MIDAEAVGQQLGQPVRSLHRRRERVHAQPRAHEGMPAEAEIAQLHRRDPIRDHLREGDERWVGARERGPPRLGVRALGKHDVHRRLLHARLDELLERAVGCVVVLTLGTAAFALGAAIRGAALGKPRSRAPTTLAPLLRPLQPVGAHAACCRHVCCCCWLARCDAAVPAN